MIGGGCGKCGRAVPLGLGVELTTGQALVERDGDFHVCLVCGSILIVDGGAWRPATLYEILNTDPVSRSAIATINRAVRRGVFRQHDLRGGAGGMVN